MVVLVSFLAGVFFVISQWYSRTQFKRYTELAQQEDASQWATLISYFYQSNGESWKNIRGEIVGIFLHADSTVTRNRPQYLELLNDKGKRILVLGDPQSDSANGEVNRFLVSTPVIANGRTVGTLLIRDRGLVGLFRLEQQFLHSMAVSLFWGTAIAVAVALILGTWLARYITSPLQRMTSAISRIIQGDLNSQLTVESSDEFGQVAMAFNEMSARLAKTEQARQRLVADVAHELRTPLTIISGQLELIQQGVREVTPETLLPIQDEILRLSRLVQDLHQLSQAEVGKLQLERQDTDIVELVEKIVAAFEIEADERGIHMMTTVSPAEAKPPSIRLYIDPHRITQVLVNLLGNALRYTPPGGSIFLDIKKNLQGVRIAVADTGPGIPEEDLPYVFNRFYRAEQGRSRDTGGMGLGLAIAREFVAAHGGSLEVTSEVGKGATFEVVLPESQLPESELKKL